MRVAAGAGSGRLGRSGAVVPAALPAGSARTVQAV